MAKKEPLFSIVIPTRNRAGELAACLASLAGLDFPGEEFETIVVDDGSREPPGRVVEPFSAMMDVKLISQSHLGPARARNTGAKTARGRYLAFTDDDCLVAPDWLTGLANRFSGDHGCAVGGRTLNALPENPFSEASQILVDYVCRGSRDDLEGPRFLTSNNLALSKKLFLEVGGFNELFRLAGGEDRELCHRLKERGARLLYAPEAMVYHRHTLNPGGFIRQHVNYGRGAFTFHWLHRLSPLKGAGFQPVSFYLGLVAHPLALPKKRGKALLVALLLLSQAANAAGYLIEGLRSPITP